MSKSQNYKINFCSELGLEYENISMTKISENTFMLDETPIFFEGASYRDIIEIEMDKDDILVFKKVVSKSQLNKHTFLLSKKTIKSENLEKVKRDIESIGDHWEQIFEGFLTIYLPNNIEYDFEKELGISKV